MLVTIIAIGIVATEHRIRTLHIWIAVSRGGHLIGSSLSSTPACCVITWSLPNYFLILTNLNCGLFLSSRKIFTLWSAGIKTVHLLAVGSYWWHLSFGARWAAYSITTQYVIFSGNLTLLLWHHHHCKVASTPPSSWQPHHNEMRREAIQPFSWVVHRWHSPGTKNGIQSFRFWILYLFLR